MGVQFTDKFIQEPDNVTLLLTLLEVGLELAGIFCSRRMYKEYFTPYFSQFAYTVYLTVIITKGKIQKWKQKIASQKYKQNKKKTKRGLSIHNYIFFVL